MNSQRAPFVSGLVLGVGVGLVLSHLWIHHGNDVDSLISQQPDLGTTAFSAPSLNSLDPVDSPFFPDFQDPTDTSSEIPGPLLNALALETTAEPLQQTNSQLFPEEAAEAKKEPEPLKVQEASPLNHNSETDQKTIRIIVDHELSHLPAEKREVWFEALKDVNKEDVAGILKMWKLLGGPIPEAPVGISPLGPESPFPEMPQLPSSAFSPIPEAERSLVSPAESRADAIIEEIQLFTQANQLMQNTPGYVPQLPYLTHDDINQATVTAVDDFLNVRHVRTGFPLDLAIQGPGFFEVVDDDGIVYLTRLGRFSIDHDGKIVLPTGLQTLRLADDVRLEAGWNKPGTKLVVDPYGQVQLARQRSDVSDEVEYTKQGTITVKLPASSHHLLREGHGLYRVSEEARAHLMTLAPTAVAIESGAIELPGSINPAAESLLKAAEQLK